MSSYACFMLFIQVGSQCTVLTDNYCEEAYDLLETPNLKKLLVLKPLTVICVTVLYYQDFSVYLCFEAFFCFQLAGILLDTQNLNNAAKFFTNRDAEAVQLLLVGSAPSQRHELFEQCTLLF